MPLSLPKPIANYFSADAMDGGAVANCFTADAVVVDDEKTYSGRDAIARWKTESSAKYDYYSEPISVEEQDEIITVTALVKGNFPGSPVDLRYAFTVAGGAIARLEIK